MLSILLILFSGNIDSDSGVIKLNQKISSPVFKKYDNKLLFVFFGYVGCADVCTPRLEELSKIYKDLNHKEEIDINTIFVNLIKLQDSELPQLFAEAFHKDFKGVYLKDDILRELKREFDIYISKSLFDDTEYEHTAFLFLLKKNKDDYYLKRIYTNVPFDKEIIIKDILGSLND